LQTTADLQEEIEDKVKNHGAKGIKLHPASNRFFPYDRSLWPAYATAMEMGLPILFHSGTAEIAGYTETDFARPRHFAQVLQNFPKLTVILAHFGKGFLEEALELAQKYDNVYFDTSAIISGTEVKGGFSNAGQAVEMMRAVGVPRILFGSDWPWYDPLLAIEHINSLNFTEEEKRKILGENAAKIFCLFQESQI